MFCIRAIRKNQILIPSMINFLEQYSKIELESADEYSIVVARMAVKYTDVPVYYTDEKFD